MKLITQHIVNFVSHKKPKNQDIIMRHKISTDRSMNVSYQEPDKQKANKSQSSNIL